MKSSIKIKSYLKRNSDLAFDVFSDELSTDENKDYRRGFRAGILCAFLQIQAEVAELDNDDENK